MIKKTVAFLLITVFTLCCAVGFFACEKPAERVEKVDFVASSFVVYDALRYIVGESNSYSLVQDKTEQFSDFAPTASDILQINSAKAFFYCSVTDGEWVDAMLPQIVSGVVLVDVAYGVQQLRFGGADVADKYVFTSFENLAKMAQNINAALALFDMATSEYNVNASAYTTALNDKSVRYSVTVPFASKNTIVFAGSFPMRYFANEIQLVCVEAGGEGGPAAQTLTEQQYALLKSAVLDNELSYFLYDEYSDATAVARLASESGAQGLKINSLYSYESTVQDSYITLYFANLDTILTALGSTLS